MRARKRVAVTGMGVISSLGRSTDLVHAHICQQQAGYGCFNEYVFEGLACRLGGPAASFHAEELLPGRPLRPLDRNGRLVAAATALALSGSGWSPECSAANDIGLVLGTMFSSMHTITQFDWRAMTQGPSTASPMDFANTVINSGAGQGAIWHKLRGINSTIATGLTSGLMALGYACDLISDGRQQAILAGGSDEFSFESFFACERAGALCGSGDRELFPVPFDERRNGFALTEASAMLMLEDWDFAQARGARILAEICGHGNAYDPPPSQQDEQRNSIARAMRLALHDAQMEHDMVDLISASANGSVLHDRLEAEALRGVFPSGRRQVPVTAIKSSLGETLGSSGAIQTISVIEAIRTSEVPGIRGLEFPDPSCSDINLLRESAHREVKCGLINSVGFDGHACSLLVRQPTTAT